ncbi:NACHT, LRR and PYD domains-containing protein 11 isoform X2 [Phacochoerus africanus]|uniref:NACHT, LRR and PYD domains-containing protein 11 isoform X2 n=1 Tax=Phacochoerus africanus TaxID=41426 RepID=UPI001FD886B5|nr:NACHT, LRR and PYD domains-containing protein 11 isoform X2 [Phacochoerus africanus]
MTETDSPDFDLLWYLEKLNKKEFMSLKNHLKQECLEIGLPEIPGFDLRTAKPDLVNLLTTFYEAQHVWNMMLSIFQKIRRADLCEKIKARRKRNRETHKALIKNKILLQWEKCLFENVHNTFYEETIVEVLRKLDTVYDPRSTFYTKDVFLVGEKGAGKTMVMKVVLLQWTHGDIWKDVISYIVHLTSHEINQMSESSLVELISKEWPSGQAPVADILSDSQKLLFILEDMDNVDASLNVDESALCSDSRKHVPVSVLLSSLFKRKMAPGSLFLISLRPDGKAAVMASVKKNYSITLKFSDEKRKKYFALFFKDSQKATRALKLVQENDMFVNLCQVPVSCWITCVALNRQVEMGGEGKLSCQTLTDLYAHFLANTLTSGAGIMTSQRRRTLLERLCLLALEGLWHDMLHFTDADLRSVGLTKADVSALKALRILLPSSNCTDRHTFIHLKIQEFCAAVGYMMLLSECQIPSANKKYPERRERYNDFSPITMSIFGLLNEKRRKILETSIGCNLLTGELKKYFLQKMKYMGDHPKTVEHHMPLFYCLFENQDEEFVKQIMDSFLEVTIYIQENKDLMVSLYCLEHCRLLQKLKLSVQCIFENKEPHTLTPSYIFPSSSKMRSLVYWRDLCNLLHTKENLKELEICNSDFDDTSERVLCKALTHSSCHLQTLKLSYLSVGTRFEDVFRAIVYNPNLKFLSLNCVPHSLKMFSLLGEVLENPVCRIQHLSLMKCDLKASECQEIASLLIKSKNLKKLTLSNNPLKNEGVKILCNALLHPDCTLESLVLLFCCLTKTGCISIGRVLMLSKTLKHLDLGVNLLENLGVSILTLPLMFPTCKLQELELEECMLTSGCCASLASVLIRSKTLKKLNLLGNDLRDEGILQLLEALGHPDCVLEAVGLQINSVAAETRKSLLTVKKKNTRLTLLYQSWAAKKGREVSYNVGDIRAVSLPPTVPVSPRLNWHLICFHMPRKFRHKKSAKVSKQPPPSSST